MWGCEEAEAEKGTPFSAPMENGRRNSRARMRRWVEGKQMSHPGPAIKHHTAPPHLSLPQSPHAAPRATQTALRWTCTVLYTTYIYSQERSCDFRPNLRQGFYLTNHTRRLVRSKNFYTTTLVNTFQNGRSRRQAQERRRRQARAGQEDPHRHRPQGE